MITLFDFWAELAHETAALWIDTTLLYSALINDTPHTPRKR